MQSSANRDGFDPEKVCRFRRREPQPVDEDHRLSLRDRQRGDGPQEIETIVGDLLARVVLLDRSVPNLHDAATQSLPVEVQGRSVEVARWRLHLSDL